MLSVVVGIEVVDENGDTTWARMQLMPSDDPDRDFIDISFLDVEINEGDSIMADFGDMSRALKVLKGERGKLVEGEG